MEKFTIGLLLGGIGGALLAANSCKMRTLVRKGQEEIKQRLDEMMDENSKRWKTAAAFLAAAPRITNRAKKCPKNQNRRGRVKTTARRNAENNFP